MSSRGCLLLRSHVCRTPHVNLRAPRTMRSSASSPCSAARRLRLMSLAANHDAVPINGATSELPHAPRFVTQRLADLRLCCNDASIVFVNIVDHQVAEVGVVPKLPWWDGIAALASHDLTAVL